MVKTYFMLFFACAIWGFQPACVKLLVAEWPPAAMIVVRYAIIALMWFAAAWHAEGKNIMPHKEDWKWLISMGFLGILLNNVLQFTGLQYTTVTNCTLISATQPAVTACIAFFLIRERLSLAKWIGIFISFGGVFAVVSGGSLEVIRQINFNTGDMLCLAAQLSWAAYSFLSLRVMKDLSVEATTFWFCLFGGIMTAVYGAGSGTLQFVPLSPGALISFLYIVFLGGFCSLFFYNVGVKNAGPSVAAIFLNIMPVVGIFSGFMMFDDYIGPTQMGGAAAIIAGVFMTTHHWKHPV